MRPTVQTGSIRMNLKIDRSQGVAILRVGEPRLMYPLLATFTEAATLLLAGGECKLLVDLSTVDYVDSATIGCLMDLYRRATAAGGTVKLTGVRNRVDTMLSMTGAQHFIEMHPDEAAAVRSFGE